MNPDLRQHLLDGEHAGSAYRLSLPERTGQAPSGIRMGSRAGRSIEFKDFRDYQPGDDLRWIDWNIFARTDRLTVKLYHEEVCAHLDLLLDTSRSMALPGTDKPRTALFLAAVCGAAAANAGCTSCCWSVGDDCRRAAHATSRPGAWDALDFNGVSGAADAFFRSPPSWRRQGTRVFISDLLWPGDPLPLLNLLANHAARVFILQVMNDADTAAPARGSIRLDCIETGEELELFVDAAAEQYYTEALARHLDAWREACRRTGAVFVPVPTAAMAPPGNLDLLQRAGLLEAG